MTPSPGGAEGTVVDLHPPGRTVVVTGGPHPLAERLAHRLLGDGDRVVVLTAQPDLVPQALRASPGRLLVVEHDPEDPLPAGLGSGVDVVVHTAVGPLEHSLRGMSSPTLGTLLALRVARDNGARLVIASLPGNAEHRSADEALAAGFSSSHDVDVHVVAVGEGEDAVVRLADAMTGPATAGRTAPTAPTAPTTTTTTTGTVVEPVAEPVA